MTVEDHLPERALLKVVVKIEEWYILVPPFPHQKISEWMLNREENDSSTWISGKRKIAEELKENKTN